MKEQNNDVKNIYQSLAAIIKDCGAISKDKVNKLQNYKFRGIDDLYNAVHPLFAEHGVFITSKVIERNREERTTKNGGLLIYTILTVEFTFHAMDGTSVTSITDGEAMDSSDKSTNKAMSAALKYCLMQMLLIPTEELKDADITTPEPQPKPTPTQPKQKPNLTQGTKVWDKIVTRMIEEDLSVDVVKQHYTLTKDDETELLKEVTDKA